MLLNGSLMTLLCFASPTGPAQEGRVTIEVEARPGITTIVITGELDLVTMPFLAAQLALAAREVLFTFYSRDLLLSPEARQRWHSPDLRPLDPSLL